MLKNVGSADRIIRTLFAVVVFILILAGILTGTIALILGITAGVLLGTALVGFCPIYGALKLSSNKKNKTVEAK